MTNEHFTELSLTQTSKAQDKTDNNPNVVPKEVFFDLVARLIDSANSETAKHSPQVVSSAILYAAARFNAYLVAQSAGSKESYQQEQESAEQFFKEQYQAMFKENFSDYLEHYDAYLNWKKP